MRRQNYSKLFNYLGLAVLVIVPCGIYLWLHAPASEAVLRRMSDTAFSAYMVFFTLGWWTLLLFMLSRYLKSRDRGWFSGRPTRAIAGKNWSVPAAEIAIPVSLLGSIAYLFYSERNDLAFAAPVYILLGSVVLFGAFLRARRAAAAQRKILAARDESSLIGMARGETPDARSPLAVIADIMGVAPGQLRPTDRFKFEVGTASPLDSTLDTLTIRLLRSRPPPIWLEVERIETVRDYCDSWVRLHKS